MPRLAFRSSLFALLVLAALAGAVRADDADRPQTNQELRERIAALIEALGSDEYAVRERAQNELAQLGDAAFDDLLVARQHSDVEIAQRAVYLIERMGIELIEPDDALEVRQILSEYENLSSEDRIRRMQRLALLPDWGGAVALCRLVRFDDTDYLSKKAALLLLQQETPDTQAAREELAERLENSIYFSRRDAADWVRGYAETLREPAESLTTWQTIVDREWNEYQDDPRQLQRAMLRDLMRWQVDLLLEQEQQEQAFETMESSLSLIEPAAPEVMETIDWLMTREAWPVIDKMYEQFDEVCQGNPELTYRLAEVRLKQGQHERAEQLAAEARGHDPDKLQNHDLLARALRQRGMIDWAEAEYRYVLEQVEEGTPEMVWYRYSFAEMLHDQLRDGEAAEVLEPALQALRDRNVAAVLQNMQLDADHIIGRAHYFSACHFAQQGDLEKQASHLQVAIARDELDLDTIIALYNMPETDQSRREQNLAYLQRARDHLEEQVELWEIRMEREAREPHLEAYRNELAKWCNQYAWLVCNTEGDYEDALRCSERSLELISATGPRRAGYLDTLAHCHFALQEYEEAVLVQEEAISLEPHSGQMQRALARFREAYSAQQSGQ